MIPSQRVGPSILSQVRANKEKTKKRLDNTVYGWYTTAGLLLEEVPRRRGRATLEEGLARLALSFLGQGGVEAQDACIQCRS